MQPTRFDVTFPATPIGLSRVAYVAMAVVALLPLATVDIAPLVDYPNHIARMHVLTQNAGAATSHYVTSWRPIPNLGIDLVVPPLARLLGVYEAGRLFLALCLLTLAAGICALHRAAHGTLGAWPIVSLLILYSLPLAWGFLNFYLSVGLALLLFAAWIARRRPVTPLALLLFNLAVAALYLTHLFGAALYGVCVAVSAAQAIFASRDWRLRNLLHHAVRTAGQFGLVVLLYAGLRLLWANDVAPLDLGSWSGDLLSKVSALGAAFLFQGHWSEFAVLVLLLLVLLAAAVTGRLAVAPALRWHLPVFLVLTLAAPAVYRGLYLDARLGFVLACLAIAALRPAISGKLVTGGFLAAALALGTAKSLAVSDAWSLAAEDYREYRAALQRIPAGAKVLSAHDHPGATAELSYSVRWRMAILAFSAEIARAYTYRNLASLAVIERDAFVPSLFTYPSAQPIQAVSRLRRIDAVQPARRLTPAHLAAAADPRGRLLLQQAAEQHNERLFWIDWPRDFDYVIVFNYHEGPAASPLPGRLSRVAAGSFFDIYQVRRDDPGAR